MQIKASYKDHMIPLIIHMKSKKYKADWWLPYSWKDWEKWRVTS